MRRIGKLSALLRLLAFPPGEGRGNLYFA